MTESVETPGAIERDELLAVDTNQDGVADVLAIDTDGNGKADLFQLDSDGDGSHQRHHGRPRRGRRHGHQGRRRRRAPAGELTAAAGGAGRAPGRWAPRPPAGQAQDEQVLSMLCSADFSDDCSGQAPSVLHGDPHLGVGAPVRRQRRLPGRRVLVALGLVDVVGDRDQLRAGQVVGEALPAAGRPGAGAGAPRLGERHDVVDVDVGRRRSRSRRRTGLYQRPEVAAQELSTTTEVPSRLRTVSRVSQVPLMVIQCGNRSRE